jgi:NAD(P)-dependent dehydrogenase (short-subunit alcohol dehydrogenase family)
MYGKNNRQRCWPTIGRVRVTSTYSQKEAALMAMLENKVAFITGASSGIGAGTARRFAEEGAKIVLADVQEEEGHKLQQEIENAGGQALYVECDVSSPEAVQAAITAAVEKFGRLDIVFANAGINGVWTPIEELKPEEWDKPSTSTSKELT